jgi:hypothetical protein
LVRTCFRAWASVLDAELTAARTDESAAATRDFDPVFAPALFKPELSSTLRPKSCVFAVDDT